MSAPVRSPREPRLIRALHGAALRVQLPVLLALVPLITALAGIWIAGVVVDVAFEDAPRELRAQVAAAVRLVVLVMVGATTIATLAAAAVLREVIRASVTRLLGATRAIAAGDLDYRIGARRRDELGRLADAIDSTAERLQRLEHARRHVLACVSHELRTPITIIQGHAFTLARHAEGLDAIALDRLELVQAESMRLATLVDDLVEASSMHAGGVRLRLERCDLAALVTEHAARLDHDADARELTIDVELPRAPAVVDADPGRIGQVLANLFTNAARHAPRGGIVRVAVDPGAGAGDRVVVVENECAPIPGEVVDRLFEPFVQAGGERSGSVGLGLAVAAAIVEAHGGAIAIDRDRARAGIARFELRLPAPVADAAAARRDTARVGRGARRTARTNRRALADA